MEHDPDSTMEPGTFPMGSPVRCPAAAADAAAIGYEAADPSLCTPFWHEALHAPDSTRTPR